MSRKFISRLSILLCCLGTTALAEDIDVSPETLAGALRSADPGTTLVLAPGRYDPLELRGLDGTANDPITLRSADPNDPARLAQLSLRRASHVTFDGVMFDYEFAAGDRNHFRPFAIQDSENIVIRNSVFDGDLAISDDSAAHGFPTSFGLSIRSSQNITVEGNTIHTFMRGIVTNGSSGVVIRGNDVHAIRSDGMNFAQVTNVLVEDNHIHDFLRSPTSRDHADMIQFWTNGTTEPSVGITIRNNVLNSGQGLYTQSIFMRNDQVDQGLMGPEMFYRDVLIEGNVIINGQLHGISIGETNGLDILNNTLVRNATSSGEGGKASRWTPRLSVSEAAVDVTIARNVTYGVSGHDGQDSWEVTDNVLVQNEGRILPNHYALFFVPAALEDPTQVSSFAPLPGGPLDGTGLGAPRLQEN